MKPTLLILAAGIGSRYGGIKQLDEVGPAGECIMDYSIFDAIRAGFDRVVFVINPKLEWDFKNRFEPKLKGRIQTEYVFQKLTDVPQDFCGPVDRQKPWGTGQAILSARNVIRSPFAAINADDFYGASAFRLLNGFLGEQLPGSLQFCMVGFRLAHTLSDHGTVCRGICELDSNNLLRTVVERLKIQRMDGNVVFADDQGHWQGLPSDSFVSMNCWGFTPALFELLEKNFREFLVESGTDLKSEFLIPNIVGQLVQSGQVSVKVLRTEDPWFGVTYREDKPVTVQRIQQLIREGQYPSSLWA